MACDRRQEVQSEMAEAIRPQTRSGAVRGDAALSAGLRIAGTDSSGPRSEILRSLVRGLDVLAMFSASRPLLTIAEVAGATGETRATVRRVLLTLESCGLLIRNGRYFQLTPRVLDFGHAYLAGAGFTDAVEQVLKETANRLSLSCSLSVLDDTEIVYVARVPTKRIIDVTLGVGARLPAYATSMGRVLLAALPPDHARDSLKRSRRTALTPHTLTRVDDIMNRLDGVREHGYAVIDQELEIGLRSFAVPVYGSTGHVIAAVNAAMPAGSGDIDEGINAVVPVLREASRGLTAVMPASARMLR